MDAKKKILRTMVLLLPVAGILLALKIYPATAPALRRDVAFKNDSLDFTGESTPPIVLPKRSSRRGSALESHPGRPRNFDDRLSLNQEPNRSSPAPEIAWTKGMFVLGTRSQAESSLELP